MIPCFASLVVVENLDYRKDDLLSGTSVVVTRQKFQLCNDLRMRPSPPR